MAVQIIGDIPRAWFEGVREVVYKGARIDVRDASGNSVLSGEPIPAPVAIGTVTDRSYFVGGAPVTIDFTGKFSGAGGYVVTPDLPGVTMTGGVMTLDRSAAFPPTLVTVRALSAGGEASQTFTLEMKPVVAPALITLSAPSATVVQDDALPIALASLSADGTQPVTWAVVSGASYAEIAGGDLRLVAMPPVGAQSIRVRASNAGGQAEATFALTVAEAVVAPTTLTIDPPSGTVLMTDPVPATVATLAVNGTGPYSWTITGADAAKFAVDSSVTPTVLRLTGALATAGGRQVRVRAANAEGYVEATFGLEVQQAPVVTRQPAITGTPEVGQTLAYDPGEAVGHPTPAIRNRQWTRGGAPIAGATGSTYVVAAGDANIAAGHEWAGAGPAVAVAAPAVTVVSTATAPAQYTTGMWSVATGGPSQIVISTSAAPADGGSPITGHDYSLDNGATWGAMAGNAPWTLTMPAAGTEYTVHIRAKNAVGAGPKSSNGKAATSGAAAISGAVTASSGTAAMGAAAGDGSRVLTITGGDYPGSYTLTAAEVAGLDAGHVHMLAAPAVTVNGETYTVGSGLYIYPPDDVPIVTQSWMRDGSPNGATGTSYTRTGDDSLFRGQVAVRYTNSAMEAASAAKTVTVDAWTAPTLTVAPMHFRSAEADFAEWNVSGLQDATKAVYYCRFQYLPTPDDLAKVSRDASYLYFGASAATPGDAAIQNHFKVNASKYGLYGFLNLRRPDGTVSLTYAQVPLPPSGAVVEAVAVMGVPVSDGDTRNSVRINIYFDGVLQHSKVAAPAADWIIGSSGYTRALLGAKTVAAGDTHDLYRAAVWLGSNRKMDDLVPLFRKPDGGLAHPQMAVTALGTPLLDFYNGINHGSLGAPATMSNLA